MTFTEENRTRTLSYMRAIPAKIGTMKAVQHACPKSLSHNILPVTYLESRFCGNGRPACSTNHNRINILQESEEKFVLRRSIRKSLSRNILPAKYLESILYAQHNRYPTYNQHRINILGIVDEKN